MQSNPDTTRHAHGMLALAVLLCCGGTPCRAGYFSLPLDELETVLAELGLAQERLTVRMTGCPNGCARPYNADVGLVGKSRNRYTIFLGGSRLGEHLGSCYGDQVPVTQIVATLKPLLEYFRSDREPDESFGDFCRRRGPDDLQQWVARNATAGT